MLCHNILRNVACSPSSIICCKNLWKGQIKLAPLTGISKLKTPSSELFKFKLAVLSLFLKLALRYFFTAQQSKCDLVWTLGVLNTTTRRGRLSRLKTFITCELKHVLQLFWHLLLVGGLSILSLKLIFYTFS